MEIITAIITGLVTMTGSILTFIATQKKNRIEADKTHQMQIEQLRDSLENRMEHDRQEALKGMDIVNAHIKENNDNFLEMRAQTQTYQAVIEEKIIELSRRVELHNQVVERTYALESKSDVLEEKVKVANNRIADLEGICNAKKEA